MDNSYFKASTCEIVETREEIICEFKIDEKPESSYAHKSGKKYSIEDDINSLFQAIDIKNSARGLNAASRSKKSALKKPIKVTPFQASGIGFSEPVSLKQAFRGLCISQASEMAALKRSLPKPSKVSESRTIKKLHTAEVDEGQGQLVEFSIVPEMSTPSDKFCTSQTSTSTSSAHHSTPCVDATNAKTRFAYRNQIVPLPSEVQGEKLVKRHEKQILANSSSIACPSNEKQTLPASSCKDSFSSSMPVNGVDKPTSSNTSLAKPIFNDNNFIKRKVKKDLCSSSSCSTSCTRKNGNESTSSSTGNWNKVTENSDLKDEMKENESHSSKPSFCLRGNKINKFLLTKFDEKTRSKEKGEVSQCSKSMTGENNLSSSSCSGQRPHMSKDMRWEAINVIEQQHGNLSSRHFKLLRRLGYGDIGTVYLAELIGTSCLFALKVVDKEFLVSRKKMLRVQTEREILQMLDHPFLPTLYAHIATNKLSCLVMDYCPGGDLHVLRQRQPYKRFSEQATRFYVAEVLLALEYLHMLGIVYRDLKPENILIREDGHIMLTDFDLSLRCCVNPMLVNSSSQTKKTSSFCLQPNWQVSCFTPSILLSTRKIKADIGSQVGPLPQVVVEPTSARSNSFVGTYEYLAPEIIKGEGHGSAVDCWTLGICLFELLYGKTPFKGPSNQDTLANVVSQTLKFPNTPIISSQARDLIRGLLIKDPQTRLGSVKGAADIKHHSFFEGLNWALIRCAPPPELPKFRDFGTSVPSLDDTENCEEFDLF